MNASNIKIDHTTPSLEKLLYIIEGDERNSTPSENKYSELDFSWFLADSNCAENYTYSNGKTAFIDLVKSFLHIRPNISNLFFEYYGKEYFKEVDKILHSSVKISHLERVFTIQKTNNADDDQYFFWAALDNSFHRFARNFCSVNGVLYNANEVGNNTDPLLRCFIELVSKVKEKNLVSIGKGI